MRAWLSLALLCACGGDSPTTALFALPHGTPGDDFYATPFPNDLWREANGTIDPARQKAAFAKLNAAIVDEAWVVSIAYRQSVFGLAKHVDGFAFTVDDMAVLENVSREK